MVIFGPRSVISTLVIWSPLRREIHAGSRLHTYNKSTRPGKIHFFVGNIHTRHIQSFFVSKTNFTLIWVFWVVCAYLTTCDPIRVEIILRHHYILIPIYKLVISIFLSNPQVKWYLVTGFAYRSVIIYIVVMRWDLPNQDPTSFN